MLIYFTSYLVSVLALIPALMSSVTTSGNTPDPNAMARRMAWFPFLITATAGVLSLVKDAVFISIARNRLLRNFRAVAIKSVLPIHINMPPPPLPRSATPPPPPLPRQ